MKCVSAFSEAFLRIHRTSAQKELHFSFPPYHTPQKVQNIRAKMDNVSAKQVRFHRKVVLFFRSLRSLRSASLNEKKKVGEKEKKGSTEKTERAVSSKEAQQSQTQTTSFAI